MEYQPRHGMKAEDILWAILSTIGTALFGLFVYLIKKAIDKGFVNEADKAKKAEEHTAKITEKLTEVAESLSVLSTTSLNYFKRTERLEEEIQATALKMAKWEGEMNNKKK